MTTVQRKRRHFRDDLKKQILSDIEAGKLSINNVTDPTSGKPIKALLIERWKDQFRTEGMGANFQPTKRYNAPTMNTDDLLKEIGRLTVENNQLKRNTRQQKQAFKSDLSYSSASSSKQHAY